VGLEDEGELVVGLWATGLAGVSGAPEPETPATNQFDRVNCRPHRSSAPARERANPEACAAGPVGQHCGAWVGQWRRAGGSRQLAQAGSPALALPGVRPARPREATVGDIVDDGRGLWGSAPLTGAWQRRRSGVLGVQQ